MLWCLPYFKDGLKKRACRYLLQRYLGQFLSENKISLDQLTVDLYNGTGNINGISLDVQALNEIGESYNLPLEFVDGYVESISVSVPWSSLLRESSNVEVHGLMLTLQPKRRSRNVSTLDSLWDSMCSMSSMQMAKDVLGEDEEEELEEEMEQQESTGQAPEGLTRFANTIDTVFQRIKVSFTDVVFRIEHTPKGSRESMALEIRVDRMDYCDEAGMETLDDERKDEYYQPPPFSVRNFRIHGMSIYIDQVPITSCWRMNSSSSSMQPTKSPDLSPNNNFVDPVQQLVSPEGTPKVESMLSPEEKEESNPILVAKLTEPLELKLRLKQDETHLGPKVDIELNTGAVPLFLCPSQVHLLGEFALALYLPDVRNNARGSQYAQHQQQQRNKPMGSADFCLVEQELQKQLSKPSSNGRSLRQLPHQAWSSHSLDDSEDSFHPARARLSMHASRNSSVNQGSDMDNSFNSRYTGLSDSITSRDSFFDRMLSIKAIRTGGTVQELLSDECSNERSTFHVTLGSLFIVLLQEDVTPVTPTCQPNKAQRKEAAETYFDRLSAALTNSRTSLSELALSRDQFTKICGVSHLRLLAYPLKLEGSQRASSNDQFLTTSLAVSRFDFVECLVDKVTNDCSAKPGLSILYTQLLRFMPNETALRLDYLRRDSLLQRFKEPYTKIDCKLGSFTTEVDISIVDRLQALLQPSTSWSWSNPNSVSVSNLNIDDGFRTERTDIRISSPKVKVKLRFPVPDLRSVHSLERLPWWQKSVRKESLLVELSRVSLATTFDSRPQELEILFKDARGAMEMCEGEEPIPFARVSVDPDDDPNKTEEGFGLPRLVLRWNPETNPSLLDAEAQEEDPEEFFQPMMTSVHPFQLRREEPSPFACRRVAYDSSSPQQSQAYDSITPETTDQVVLPSDKEHMSEFIDKTMSNSRITLDFTLPSVHIFFPSKDFYEVFFNRVTTDLLLWSPAAPQPMSTSQNGNFDFQTEHFLKQNNHFEAFSFCKSGAQYVESSSDSEDGGGFYSIAEGPRTLKFKMAGRQSSIAMNIAISQGIFNFKPPLLDGQSIPVDDFSGEFQINVSNGTLFTVSGHNGDPHVSYTCFLLNDGGLFHQGKVSSAMLPPAWIKGIGDYQNTSHLTRTLYRSGPEVLCRYPASTGFHNTTDASDLFSIVVRTGLDENRKLKTFKVALGLQEATLRHTVSPSQQSWLTQLLDFFNVANHPVAGYNPPAVITELHLHLRSCAIDYRPLYLPLRALATVENFSISSNLAAQSTTSLLRIISEELCLFISNKTNTDIVDPNKNYVCVLDTGLFDISLRKTDGKDPKVPELDLRATNNTVHVHTCADSCRALQELLVYVVSDGDLVCDNTDFFDAQEAPSVLLGGVEGGGHSLVGRLMADAMIETPFEGIEEESLSNCDDEENHNLNRSCSGIENDSKENFFSKDNILDDIDDEDFCILEEDLGTGILPIDGEPQVRSLSMEPLCLIENHFNKTTGRQDLLKAPMDYPPPVRSYTLREMSLVWHLYGGSDFQPTQPKAETEKKARVVIDETQEWKNEYYSAGLTVGPESLGYVSYKKNSQHESVWDNLHSADSENGMGHPVVNGNSSAGSDSANRSPKWGGKLRCQEVCVELQMNKVRFQHEEYASNFPQASRQVLLVQEVEIRDRLETSNFNKFLYQFTSEANPKQTHAHMLVIKATHVRTDPENPSSSECSLRVSLKPLRLNIDQDTLIFLCTFFSQLNNPDASAGPNPGSPFHENQSGEKLEDLSNGFMGSGSDIYDPTVRSSSPPTYFRSFVFSPDVLIQLDYQGKRLNMEQGALAGFLMGLGQLNRSKLMLKRLSYRHGLLGVDRLFAYAVHEWLQDIKKNQLPSILGGVGPMSSFVQLFQGVRDLIWLPIEQYRKDGRLMRGLQRGASSFTTSTTVACLELTGRLVHLIQGAAEFAYDMVSPGPSVTGQQMRQITGPHHSEPMDIREGVAKAYNVVRDGLGDTARTIVRVAAEEHEHKGVRGAVGGVLRQIPPTAVKPILLATEATRNVLEGVRYQLAPDARREAVEKWRERKNH